MKKTNLSKSLLLFSVLGVFLISVGSVLAIDVDPLCTNTIPGDDPLCDDPAISFTIQGAIDNSNPGDTINVANGYYVESLTINKAITLNHAGNLVTTIEGIHTITSSNVTVNGFTLSLAGSGTAVTIDSSSSAINNVTITNAIFDITTSPSIGVYIGGATPTNKLSAITISDSVFNGPTNMVSNPFKIGGQFTTPISAEVEDVNFERNNVNYGSIPINLHNKDLTDILFDENVFRNTDGVVYVWNDASEDPTGVLSEFVFTNNDVDSTNSYGLGIDVFQNVFDDSNFGDGIKINNNLFVGIPGAYGFDAVSISADLTTFQLDATYNYWGDPSGPGGAGPGLGDNVSINVLYDPWYTDSALTKVYGVVVSKLRISDLDVKVNGETDKNIQGEDDGYTIDETARPGETVEFYIEVENTFNDDEEDLRIEDIEVRVTIVDIDDGDDLEEESDKFDIKPEKNEDITLSFEIPLEVDEGEYDVIIEIDGEDEDGTIHEIRSEFKLEVDKDKHDIRFVRVAVTPSVIGCQREITINAEIINLGSEDEDDVTLEITGNGLEISSITTEIEIEEGTDDNRFTKQIREIISDDVAPGIYQIGFSVYYDSKLSESKTVELTVEKCKPAAEVVEDEEVEEEKESVDIVFPETSGEEKTEKAAAVSFRDTDGYTILLILLIVVLAGIVIFVTGAAIIAARK